MVVPKPSLTGVVKRVPWIALICALVAIGYCVGLWIGGMSTLETLKVCIPSADIEACISTAETQIVLPEISLVIDLVGLLFGAIALWVACSGLNTWKNELKHKRNIELFDYIMKELLDISSTLGLMGNIVKAARMHHSLGNPVAYPGALDCHLKLNHAVAHISSRIQNEAVVNTNLLAEFRKLELKIRTISLFLSGLELQPKVSPANTKKLLELEEQESSLVENAEGELILFKEFCRMNLTFG